MPEINKSTIENPRGFGRKNEIRLAPQQISVDYVINRLKLAKDPVVIKCQLGNKSQSEIAILFSRIVDSIKADIWLKHSLLFADMQDLRITFENECIVYFSE